MNVLCLTKRWQHHSPSSGYDRLAEFIATRCISRGPQPGLAFRAWHALPFLARAPYRHVVEYCMRDLAVECQALSLMSSRRFDVVHALYGDEQLDLLLRKRKRFPARLVASFHLPWSRSRTRFTSYHHRLLDQLDGAITVSSDLAADLRNHTSIRHVRYIPHGIDVEAFCPGPAVFRKTGRLRLLTVGSHMRDLGLVERIAARCHERRLPVDFVYVASTHAPPPFTGGPNILERSALSEGGLMDEYRSADALLLPLASATANNSLLESLACGTPVICTHIGGIPDYLDDQSGWLLPSEDDDAWQNLVETLCANSELCRQKSAGARAMARRFSWRLIADEVRQFYSELTGCHD